MSAVSVPVCFSKSMWGRVHVSRGQEPLTGPQGQQSQPKAIQELLLCAESPD